MKNVEISVIIPVYNVEKYLEECINSVLKQDFMEYEVICVNDGSSDCSLQILQQFAKKDSRVKVISQINQGLSGARNTGIRNATGKYLIFLDSDDLLEQGALSELYRISEETDFDIINFDAQVFFMEKSMYDEKLVNYYLRKKSYGLMLGKQLFTEMMQNNEYCDSACLLFIKKAWLIENDLLFYPGIIYEDCLFTTQCMMMAKKILHINNRYYKYRIREKSIMTSQVSSKNVYGRMICYHYFLKMLHTEKFTTQQEEALVSFTRIIHYAMKDITEKLTEMEIYNLMLMPMEPTMRLELEQIGLNGYFINLFYKQKEFEEEINNVSKIEIYGAGIRGKRFLEYLRLNELDNKVKTFVVTKKDIPENQICGIAINSMDKDWKMNKENLILISFYGKEAEELAMRLENDGYKNVKVMDVLLNDIICKNIRLKLKL